VKAGVSDHSRSPSDLKGLRGLNAIVGRTRQEAEDKFQYVDSLIDPIVAREILSTSIGIDLSALPLDEPPPEVQPTAARLVIFSRDGGGVAGAPELGRAALDKCSQKNVPVRSIAP
jgi:alkanesulfonate monooxygenase SsuD/methylene tetrahydromethanopterin reductase-like flavin-dependent oxidoreductase (luciferase family)